METIKTVSRIHPLVAVAAVAVIALSGVGIAAITGVLPASHGSAFSSSNATMPVAISPENPPSANNAGAPDMNIPPPPASEMAQQAPPPDYRPAEMCSSCGTVASVRSVQHEAKPSGVGAVAGALIGGVIGNRFGGGNGRVLTTVGGAVGGGMAGNEIEKRTHTTSSYVVQVRMENGKLRNFPSATQPAWNVGDRVKIANGNLIARN